MPRRSTPLGVCTLIAASVVLAAGAAFAEDAAPATEDQKILYALGFAMSRNLASFGFDDDEVGILLDGIRDGILTGEADVPMETFAAKIEPYLQTRQVAIGAQEKQLGAVFRDEQAAEEGAVRTDSGLVFQDRQAGDGASPAATDEVRVHYHGTFRDGRVFDSSRVAGEPVTFALNGVVPCFSEGIQRMRVGGKARLICPPELAYGEEGYAPMIPPGATLVFDIELLGIVPAAATEPPADPPATP